MKALQATGKPVILVNCSGSAVAMPWESEHCSAILQAWYPGQAGGTAVAAVLFGETNPAGRLPVTFYRSTGDLPDFSNYAMTNRTYRYFHGTPLYAFGHGLSYTTFTYGNPGVDRETVNADDTLSLSIPVSNTGSRDGDEVVQVYYRPVKAQGAAAPNQALCGFSRMAVPHGQTVTVKIPVPISRFRHWDVAAKKYRVEPGDYEIRIGASSSDIRQARVITVR